jgi:hypothetical protein
MPKDAETGHPERKTEAKSTSGCRMDLPQTGRRIVAVGSRTDISTLLRRLKHRVRQTLGSLDCSSLVQVFCKPASSQIS